MLLLCSSFDAFNEIRIFQQSWISLHRKNCSTFTSWHTSDLKSAPSYWPDSIKKYYVCRKARSHYLTVVPSSDNNTVLLMWDIDSLITATLPRLTAFHLSVHCKIAHVSWQAMIPNTEVLAKCQDNEHWIFAPTCSTTLVRTQCTIAWQTCRKWSMDILRVELGTRGRL